MSTTSTVSTVRGLLLRTKESCTAAVVCASLSCCDTRVVDLFRGRSAESGAASGPSRRGWWVTPTTGPRMSGRGVGVVPGLPDFWAESAAVGHRQADAVGPGADFGGVGFGCGRGVVEVGRLDHVVG